jgi:hypothetical protein
VTRASAVIGGATEDATPLGIAERDLLGHQLADDERKIGDDGDHDGDPDRLGGPWPDVERLEPVGQILGQGGPAKCAGEHADERDADLNAGKEAGLIVEQTQRRPGSDGTSLGHGGETRPTRGDERELSHGEEAVEDDQEDDNGEL